MCMNKSREAGNEPPAHFSIRLQAGTHIRKTWDCRLRTPKEPVNPTVVCLLAQEQCILLFRYRFFNKSVQKNTKHKKSFRSSIAQSIENSYPQIRYL